MRALRLTLVLLFTALTALGCSKPAADSGQAGVSDAPIDPQSHAMPTSDISFSLIQMDPGARRDFFRGEMGTLKKTCPEVREAIFKGGLDGTDFWRVRMQSGDVWLVELNDGGHLVSAVSCATPPRIAKVTGRHPRETRRPELRFLSPACRQTRELKPPFVAPLAAALGEKS